LAVCTLGKDPVAAHASQLFNAKRMPSAEVLKSGVDILSLPVISTYSLVILEGTGKNHEISNILPLALPIGIALISIFWFVWTSK
jgi:hypothetical protein